MRDSVPSGSYSSVCNVLRQWQSRSSPLIESTDSTIESTDSMIITNYDVISSILFTVSSMCVLARVRTLRSDHGCACELVHF